MDSVQLAKKIIDSLVEEELEPINEEMGQQMGQDYSSQNQASVAMKPATFGAMKKQAGLVQDAHGGGDQDAHGGSVQLGTMQYTDTAAQNQASVAMKPSFATGGGAMSEEKVREDILSIFGSEDLSEEFISKAGSIYEAAVTAKVEEVAQEIHEQYELALQEQVEEVKKVLTEQLDSYLNYAVEEWLTENKLAIESGIRTEIAENFIGKLKNLFMESYIEVPENKVNLFDEMAETIEVLEARVNKELENNVELVNENTALRAVNIFVEETVKLTDVQRDKVGKLSENIEFVGEDDFRSKVKTLVENIARTETQVVSPKKTNSKNLTEETIIETETEDSLDESVDPYIRLYSDVISRTLKG